MFEHLCSTSNGMLEGLPGKPAWSAGSRILIIYWIESAQHTQKAERKRWGGILRKDACKYVSIAWHSDCTVPVVATIPDPSVFSADSVAIELKINQETKSPQILGVNSDICLRGDVQSWL